jgi:hypothetical protein
MAHHRLGPARLWANSSYLPELRDYAEPFEMLLNRLGSLSMRHQLERALKVADLPFIQSHVERPEERSEPIGAVTVGQ